MRWFDVNNFNVCLSRYFCVKNQLVDMERNFNALISIILNGVILAAFGVQFIWHEQPCPLCLLQRIGMIAVSIGALLNVRFGIKTSHYGLMLMASLLGGFIALRQIALHVCPGFPKFGDPVLGLSLYTWSFIVFSCCILAVSLLLFLYNPFRASEANKPRLSGYHYFALGFAFLIAMANFAATLMQCGYGPCEE